MEVRFLVGNLTELEVDAIVNPANSEGEMGGGVAGAIKKAGGKKIEEEAMEQAPIPVGKAIVTSAGKLKCGFVVHAPTMEVPVQRTSVKNISKAMNAALQVARDYDLRTLAIPGMGTGTGKVPVEDAARAMIEAIQKFSVLKNQLSELVLVDRNEEMVQAWEKFWNHDEPE